MAVELIGMPSALACWTPVRVGLPFFSDGEGCSDDVGSGAAASLRGFFGGGGPFE